MLEKVRKGLKKEKKKKRRKTETVVVLTPKLEAFKEKINEELEKRTLQNEK